MYKHPWTKIFILAGLLMLPSAASRAAVVEMIIIPCTPQLRPDECGVKVSVTGGTATFTTSAGDVVNVAPGTAVSVSGTGIVSQSSQSGTILNFASAGGGDQATGSTADSGATGAGGGGGGGGQTAQLPGGGGGGGGSSGGGSSSAGGGGGTATGGGLTGGGGGGGSSGGGGSVTGGGGGVSQPTSPAAAQ
jgi:hypothetical protein